MCGAMTSDILWCFCVCCVAIFGDDVVWPSRAACARVYVLWVSPSCGGWPAVDERVLLGLLTWKYKAHEGEPRKLGRASLAESELGGQPARAHVSGVSAFLCAMAAAVLAALAALAASKKSSRKSDYLDLDTHLNRVKKEKPKGKKSKTRWRRWISGD